MAMSLGPDQKVSVFFDHFVKELDDDFQSPTISKFQNYIPECRSRMLDMEESLSMDKSNVHKLIGSIKELLRAGEAHGNTLKTCADDLIKFGTMVSTAEPSLGNSFVKFGTLFAQMSSLLTNLSSTSKNILLFSLNLLYENELKGSRYKSDIKALFGQYQSARNTVEKEEKRALVQAGVNVTDRIFTAEELAGKLVTERRKFQLGVVEYMLKFNDVKTKRGVDFAEHLLGFYQAQEGYFKDGNTLLQALKLWEAKLKKENGELRGKQDEDRKRLVTAKDKVRSAMGITGAKTSGPDQVDPKACTELLDKRGYLGKRPDNALRIARRQWPKKYCTVNMEGFSLANSHNHAPHVKIPVIHFQFKDCPDVVDGRKYCFKLIAQTRTYTFDSDSEKELIEWKQAMQNCQLKLFQGEPEDTLSRRRSAYGRHHISSNTRELVKRVIARIRSLPGNDKCADCGSPDPEWLSVNLGILICIKCSGRHRELSVQYSRIRSLTLDKMKTPELLIALVMGNGVLNEVLEANLTDPKPSPDSSTEIRGEFISNKYLQHKYIEHGIDKESLAQELAEAVDSRDVKQLLQVYAEGVDLCTPLPGYPGGMTAIHLSIELEDLTSLHIVDFLLGNGRTENLQDNEGNTPLHIAVSNDNPQCVKLLLIHGADVNRKNNEGQTPQHIAEDKNYDECVELLQDALKKKLTKCEHIDIDWGVGGEGEEEIYQTPTVDSVSVPPVSLVPGPEGEGTSFRRSETAGNILDEMKEPKTHPPKKSTSVGAGLGVNGRPRPVSTYQLESRSPRVSPTPFTEKTRTPFQPTQPNVYPAPTEPAPPPPPRTSSKSGSHGIQGIPVPPTRKKRMSMFPEHLENITLDSSHHRLTVEALYDCAPDHKDELGFKEGEILVVTKKLNKDWWRGFVQNDPNRRGVFPIVYVQEIEPLSPQRT